MGVMMWFLVELLRMKNSIGFCVTNMCNYV